MRKPAVLLLSAIAVAGCWFFFQKFEVQGLEGIHIVSRTAQKGNKAHSTTTAPPVRREGETIRIASFNIQVFGTSKANKPQVMEKLAQIVRQFDVVAIQEIRSKDQSIIPGFVDLINSADRQYDYVIGERLGRSNSKEQYAFIFDRASIVVDRNQLYTVDDPDDLLHREPLVGWFRVRGPPEEEAFTFTLVNIHTDPDETDQELDALGEVFRVVLDDGRDEDDVIVLGDLNVDEHHLGELGRISGITWAISGIPTNTRGTKTYDNLVFNSKATNEFTGRSGVYDFMRQFNLDKNEALEISDHLPVWAEFSVYEGGTIGRIARQPASKFTTQVK